MRSRALLLGTLLLAASLSGCLGFGGDDIEDVENQSTEDLPEDEAQDATNETEEVEATGPELDTIWHNGSAQGGSLVLSSYCAPNCDHVYTFEVENGSTGIVVEAVWEADRDLRLDVVPPFEYCETGPAGLIYTDCPDRSQDDSGSPARVEITDPEQLALTGEWEVQIWPKDSYEQRVEFLSVVSVAYEEALPQGFSHVQDEG